MERSERDVLNDKPAQFASAGQGNRAHSHTDTRVSGPLQPGHAQHAGRTQPQDQQHDAALSAGQQGLPQESG